jgi:TonB-linked outer membrane protein, SusC/RagA family
MKNVGLRKSLRLLFLFVLIPAFAFAQKVSVTGTVKDKTGEGQIGVVVSEAGTQNAVETDNDGKFTISVAPNATLVVSMIGYVTQQIPVSGRTVFDILIEEDAQLLEEVVVIGYGTARKSDVTGSISSINEKALREIPAANMSQALQGRLPGVSISQTSTRPGQSGQIRIRGSRSLSASNDPLIVLNGIPFEGGMNDINPIDIKSIDVLKDASATAIYGSRGANGVIIITTHRGNAGEAKITYSGSFGLKSVAQQYEVFNAQEFVRLREIAGAGYPNTPAEQAMLAAGKTTNWQDLMYQTGRVTQHDISVSGGSQKGQYSMGAGVYNETTVLPGQDFTRYSLRTTVDQELGKRIKVGLSSQNSYGVTNGESASMMYQLIVLSPIAPAYNDDGSIFERPVEPNDSYYNPLLVKDNSRWAERRKRFSSFNSLYGELKFTDYLKYRVNVGLSYRQDNYGNYYGTGTPQRGSSVSSAAVQNGAATTYAIENLLYFDKTFADKHKLNAVAMYSVQETESTTSRMQATDIIADYMQYYNLGNYNEGSGSISIPAGSQRHSKTAILSYMVRVNYAYDSRYMLTLTGRRDGASVLASGNQWQTYPAASAAWNITNEEWAKNIKGINMLKLRAGYGQTAQQSVSAYSTLGSLAQNKYNYGDEFAFGYYVGSLANASLGWEYTNTFNIGLDFTLLNYRLTGSVEWYSQHTKDILLSQGLPPTSGVPGNIMKNVGETQNSGIELSLSGSIIDGKDFKWDLDASLYFNKNKIVKLNSGVDKDEARGWFVGQPINVIYDYKKVGIWQLDEAAEAARFEAKPGDVKILDYSGPNGVPDGKITSDDRHIIGNFDPKLEGGFTSRMSYKGFDFTAVGFFRVGGTLVSTIHQGASYANMLQGRRNQIKVDYWTPTNPTNKFPMPNSTDQPTTGIYGGTLGYFGAGFLKIRSLSLGYNLPQTWTNKLGVGSARLYLTVQNPFTLFSDYMKEGGVDPEATDVGTGALSGSTYGLQSRHLVVSLNTPPTRNYIFGLNISF